MSPKTSISPRSVWIGAVIALVFPTFVTWAYFYQAAHYDEGIQRMAMGTLKFLQFAFPIVWTYGVLHGRVGWHRLTTRGVPVGILFGVAIALGGWLVFRFTLESSPQFQAAIEPIRSKIAAFGVNSVSEFVALAVFYSLIHSLLEEYYWRWFVFGQLRRLLPLWTAIIISSIGFAAHHVLVLAWYFGWWSPLTVLLSTAVAIGGAFWAWLYHSSGSLVGPWLSHLVIDAAIFLIGFHLVRSTLV